MTTEVTGSGYPRQNIERGSNVLTFQTDSAPVLELDATLYHFDDHGIGSDDDRISPETVLRCTPVCGYCGTATQPERRIDRRIPYGRTTVIRLYCSERCRDNDADEGAPLLSCVVCGRSIPTLLFAAHGPLCVRCRTAGHALEGAW